MGITQSRTTGRQKRKMALRYLIFFLSLALLASPAMGFGFQQVRPCPAGAANQINGNPTTAATMPGTANNFAFCGSCTVIVAGGPGAWYIDGSGRNCCCCNTLGAPGTAAPAPAPPVPAACMT